MSAKFTPMFSIVVGDKILAIEDDCHIYPTQESVIEQMDNLNEAYDIDKMRYSQIICMFEITEVRYNGLKKVFKKAVSDLETYQNTRFNIVQDIDRGLNISYTMEFFEIQF